MEISVINKWWMLLLIRLLLKNIELKLKLKLLENLGMLPSKLGAAIHGVYHAYMVYII